MAETNWKDKPWKCDNCKFLLGIVSTDHSTLRIKWRDLFITIIDAKTVKVICRRCSRENELIGSFICPSCGYIEVGQGSRPLVNDQSQIGERS